MKFTLCLIVGLALIQLTSFSQSADCPKPSSESMRKLCSQVGQRFPDEDESSKYNYLFQSTLERMACVEKIDSEEVIIKKVQSFWNKYFNDCKCFTDDFIMAGGNILKYAVQHDFDLFFYEVIKRYKLNLNFIDPVDGKTVLDFADHEYKRVKQLAPDSERTKALKKLYDYLRNNGALYAAELPGKN